MVIPGSEKFFVGIVQKFRDWGKVRETQKMPVKSSFNWILDGVKTGSYVKDSFNASQGSMAVTQIMSSLTIIAMDPKIIQELFTSKTQSFDKSGILQIMLSPFFGNSFLFTKADDLWKAKRKSTAHAFYKDRLVHMLDIIKMKVTESITRWLEEIDKSSDGSTQIDITKEFEAIFAKNIIHISFGEDINDELIPINMRTDIQGNMPTKREKVKLNIALQETFD